jgi:hypothetical protein
MLRKRAELEADSFASLEAPASAYLAGADPRRLPVVAEGTDTLAAGIRLQELEARQSVGQLVVPQGVTRVFPREETDRL